MHEQRIGDHPGRYDGWSVGRQSGVTGLPVKIVSPTGSAVAAGLESLQFFDTMVRLAPVYFLSFRENRRQVGKGLKAEPVCNRIVAFGNLQQGAKVQREAAEYLLRGETNTFVGAKSREGKDRRREQIVGIIPREVL